MAEKHLIKKYANRKLYDTNTSRYITLNGIPRGFFSVFGASAGASAACVK